MNHLLKGGDYFFMSYIYKRPNINSDSRDFSSKIYSNVPASVYLLDSSLGMDYNTSVGAGLPTNLISALYNNTATSLSRGCNVWPFKLATRSSYSSMQRNNARDIFFNNMPYYIAKFLYSDIVDDASSFATYKNIQPAETITSFAFSLSTETYLPTDYEDAIVKAEDALTNFNNYFIFTNTKIFERIFKTNNVTFTFTLSGYIYGKSGTAFASYDYYGILTDSTHKGEVSAVIDSYVY